MKVKPERESKRKRTLENNITKKSRFVKTLLAESFYGNILRGLTTVKRGSTTVERGSTTVERATVERASTTIPRGSMEIETHVV